MNRRGFLGAIIAFAAAPAIVRADSLMKVLPPDVLILYGDGIRDDTAALQAIFNGETVMRADGTFTDGTFTRISGVYRIASPIDLPVSFSFRRPVSGDWLAPMLERLT